jgi:hypothetical protein
MKQILSLLFAAAIGSAATYFAMEARRPAEASAEGPKAAATPFAAKPKPRSSAAKAEASSLKRSKA